MLVETAQNQGLNDTVQRVTGRRLEGVTELERKPYTDNQQEGSVTEALKLENDKPFWWGHSCDRYAPEFEVTVHTAYWCLLASETFEGLQRLNLASRGDSKHITGGFF